MYKTLFATLLLVLFFSTCHSQSLDSLVLLIKDIQRGESDSVRITSNEKFLKSFEKILLQNESYLRNFDSLKNVSVQSPPDNKFRIYTWTVPHYNGDVYDYYGFIQLKTDTNTILIRLNDSTSVIKKPESEKLSHDRWLGAVYYAIEEIKKSGKTYYTLLGWKGKDKMQTQKIIEILYINGNRIKFGFPIIKTGSVFRNRMIFSFNAQASMTLHFDKKYNGIVFDHFDSTNINLPELIGPDGTYDALKNQKGKWVLFHDVKVSTKWEPKENLPSPPHEK